MTSSAIYIGIQGAVIALDRATGEQLWKTPLRGRGFVNVLLDSDRIMATTRGEAFCLDPATGHLLWRNELRGQGTGLATIAGASSSTGVVPLFREKQKKDEQAAVVAAIVASS